jgi:two-component system, OmpR family, sensor histidine kinase SenX3
MATPFRRSEPAANPADTAQLRGHLDGLRADFDSLAMAYDRMRGALEASAGAVVVWDESARVVFTNVERLVGSDTAAELLVGRCVSEALLSALSGTPLVQQVELYGPPRRSLEVSSNVIAGRDAMIGAVAKIEETTQRDRLEAMRRDFVTNVSHELRTPVGALSLLAETLANEATSSDPDFPTMTRFADRLVRESIRLSSLVDDLLSLASADTAGELTWVDVDALIDDSMSRVANSAAVANVRLECACPSGGLAVLGEVRQLTSAVYNLLDNAVKYSDAGGVVTIRAVVDPSDGGLQIEVTDTGIGIPMRDRERIFERFYRVDKARARGTGGTGLGLAIVRNIARAHGGDVSVKSMEGHGSTFTLRLPKSCVGRVDVPDLESLAAQTIEGNL